MAPPPRTGTSAAPAGGSSPGEESGPGSGGNVINLMNLSPQQLAQLKQQVEQELTFYQDAIMQLKDVQIKMQDAGNSVKALLPKDKKELLLPLTPSLYIFGEVEDPNNVIIDIGTGYHVEKNLEDAVDYFNRKVEFLSNQIEKVQQVGREKTTVRSAMAEVLEGKLQAQGRELAAAQKKSGK